MAMNPSTITDWSSSIICSYLHPSASQRIKLLTHGCPANLVSLGYLFVPPPPKLEKKHTTAVSPYMIDFARASPLAMVSPTPRLRLSLVTSARLNFPQQVFGATSSFELLSFQAGESLFIRSRSFLLHIKSVALHRQRHD